MSQFKQPKDLFFQLSMMEYKQWKSLQKWFGDVANIFISCLDAEGHEMMEPAGNQEELERLRQYMDADQNHEVMYRIRTSRMEDQIIEDTLYPNLKIAVISIKMNGEVVLNWFVVGIISDYDAEGYILPPVEGFSRVTTQKKFLEALDIIREFTIYSLGKSTAHIKNQLATKRAGDNEREMSETIRRLETNASIISALDSDEALEVVLQKMMTVLAEYLEVTGAQLYRMRSEKDMMDMIAEWTKEGCVTAYDKTQNIPKHKYLTEEEPFIISYNTFSHPKIEEQMKEYKIKALMSFPIFINGHAAMYICFTETLKERSWKLEEVKFIKNAVKIIEGVIAKRIQKNSLASSYASLESVLEHIGCGIYVRRIEDNKPLFINRYFKEIFSEEIEYFKIDTILDKMLYMGNNSGYCEWGQHAMNRWYDIKYAPITWVDGRQVMLFAAFDTTDKKKYQQKIEMQASTDFLTGLLNRMSCERDLAKFIDETNKNGTFGSILYIDLDDFKHINDGLGHQYGDALLRNISHSLKQVRGIENTCYRVGGDEFIIIIAPDVFEEEERIIRDINAIFDRPWFLKDADYYCRMSMGRVRFPDDAQDVQELIKNADVAMYAKKRDGKKRSAEYEEKFSTVVASDRRLDMEKNMRQATEGGYHEFLVYYQPVTDISLSGTPCCGAEALIRWNSEQLGFISPGEFIPLAEYLGLINPIGNYVLETACMDCKRWNENGHPNYKVNVNLSVVQLLQPDIVDIVEKTVKKTGINPKNLTLEVTEGLAIHDMERMKKILSDIKKIGVRIALDDFGTGYSSLNHIREIPFDVIKVDQSFVKDLAQDAYSQSFIKMVTELANTIGVSICVEGVETEEQYHILEGMKVRLVQGYYFDRPMPKKDFEEKYV